MGREFLKIDHMRKVFGELEVIKDISLSVQEGEVVSIIGPSGSGKSTLATGLEYQMHRRGMAAFILDGDNLRHGLCSNLKFSHEVAI